GELEEAHASLLRTQDLILELIASLALDADGEAGALARQIAPLYEYVYRRTLDASLRKDAAPLREVVRLITPMRAAWQSVLDCVQAGPVTTGVTRG
ncbi:MAG: flagellar protein FliS, partial [Dehalococcoidia bacterium]